MRCPLALPLAALVLTMPALARAEAPVVAADIAPVHSLVARVMQGVGEPGLILPPGASPHGYSMRPSEAALVESADLLVWIGDGLTPWLEKPIETLAGDAAVLGLLGLDGTITYEFREGVVFSGDDDGHGHDDHAQVAKTDGHDHDHDHDHAKADEHEGHDDAKAEGHEGHDHGAADPHAWLDPENAKLWLTAIAAALADIDPANGDAYRANATAGAAEIDAIQTAIAARFADAPPKDFVVFHDAYQYFERRFGIETLGAIALSDATDPSAGRVAQLQAAVTERGVSCAFAEPQFNPALVEALFGGTDVTTGVIDPLGADLTPGSGLYPALLTAMADTLATCR